MQKRDTFYNLLTAWGKYKDVDKDIKKYNRADTVNMSETEMNKFRHIAGPAYLTSVYYTPETTRKFGRLKEAKDFVQGRGLKDINFDLSNNEKGIELGEKSQGINQKTLFDYIFKTEIEPYREQL